MIDVTIVLLFMSLILFFGFFSEFVFKKLKIPDILFLIILGFLLGPYGFGYLNIEQLKDFTPVFTTFTLLFLMYDGAFNIDLASFIKGLGKGLGLSAYNFFVSSIVVFSVMKLFGFSWQISLLSGFILGGISSAFVIPILNQMKVKGELYFILTLESAVTDVLTIVFALTAMEIIKLNTFSFPAIAAKLVSLFAVAGFIGIISGIIWILIIRHFIKQYKSYMITVAYVVLVYLVTEFLNGNGAIAVLFLGLVLKNSKILTSIVGRIVANIDTQTGQNPSDGVSVTSSEEEMFYSQISFFLKTFFFVFIGATLSLSDKNSLIISGVIAVLLMFSRILSRIILKGRSEFEKTLTSSIFARGLAAAAVVQILVENDVPGALSVANIAYGVIVFTIILSSVRIFIARKSFAT